MKRRDLISKGPLAVAAGACAVVMFPADASPSGHQPAVDPGVHHEIEHNPDHGGFYVTAVSGTRRTITFLSYDTAKMTGALEAAIGFASDALTRTPL